MTLESGTRLGHYEIVKPLGKGGMGEVYLAQDTKLDRRVALKILPEEMQADENARKRFTREAKAAAALDHPYICNIFEIGQADGKAFLAMEYVQGPTLRDKLDKGPLTLTEVQQIAAEIAEALDKAAQGRIVHRDLKPSNIMFTAEGHVKVMDFGLARRVVSTGAAGNEQKTVTHLTQNNVLLGTPAYMSPEQIRGQTLDTRSDIFSFGVMLYEMVSGVHPFQKETAADTMSAIINETPAHLARHVEGCPELLQHTVRKMLAKEPARRYQSVHEVHTNLVTLQQDTGSAPMVATQTQPEGKRLTWQKVLPWVLLPVVAIAAAWIAAEWRSPDPAFVIESFRRLTSERGFQGYAEFSPDGRRVIYSSSSQGTDSELMELSIDVPASRNLNVSSSHVVDISSSGNLALIHPTRFGEMLWYSWGTLQRMSLAGGVPREVAKNVYWASWGPNDELVAIRRTGAINRIEYPIGEVLYETPAILDEVSFSPDGKRIAFWEGAYGGQTISLNTIDLDGTKTTLSGGWFDWWGMAWAPGGREIWFCAAQTGGSTALYAVDLSGKVRLLWSFPGIVALNDISPRGDLLVSGTEQRHVIVGHAPGKDRELHFSLLAGPQLADFSDDGSLILVKDIGDTGGRTGTVYLNKTDGSAPIRLGEGTAMALSPDGAWALAKFQQVPPRLFAIPTGPGQIREFNVERFEQLLGAAWLPRGTSILISGREPEKLSRFYLLDFENNTLSPLGPENIYFQQPAGENDHFGRPISQDGRWVVGWQPEVGLRIHSITGEESREIPSIQPEDIPIRWSKDDRFLFVYQYGQVPVEVTKIDLSTGTRTVWKELGPEDPVGVASIDRVFLDAEEESYYYSYVRVQSDLYLAKVTR